jgi:organic radical activating enzyme
LDLLVAKGYSISIETNGTRIPNITKYPYESVRYVMDYKSLSSGSNKAMKNAAFLQLRSKDFLKFVVSSEEDFKDCMERLRILFGPDPDKIMPRIAFSPIVKDIEPKALMLLMQRENFLKKIGAILNLQLHKIIGVS